MWLLELYKKKEAVLSYSLGKHQVTAVFASPDLANAFTSHPELERAQLKAFIPSASVAGEGIIRDVPIELSESQIIENTDSQYQVLYAQRQTRKVVINGQSFRVPTQSVRLSFEGRTRSDSVKLFMTHHPVDPW